MAQFAILSPNSPSVPERNFLSVGGEADGRIEGLEKLQAEFAGLLRENRFEALAIGPFFAPSAINLAQERRGFLFADYFFADHQVD